MEEGAEIIELFGVRFAGKRDLVTGRIYVPVSQESKKALAELGKVGRELNAKESRSDVCEHGAVHCNQCGW